MECSLCNWLDYESDWGGGRYIRGHSTVCPECGNRFSGDIHKGPPIPHPRLVKRLNERKKTRWQRFKLWLEKYDWIINGLGGIY